MTRTTRRDLAALSAGALFGAGLAISGMTKPSKVLGFLDLFGAWDASLMFVMLGAIGVHWLAYRFIRGKNMPLFADKFTLPTRRDLDMKLLLGAAIFGVGWGLAGYCPGPSLTSLAAGSGSASLFAAAMLLGMLVTARLERSPRIARRARSQADAQRDPRPTQRR